MGRAASDGSRSPTLRLSVKPRRRRRSAPLRRTVRASRDRSRRSRAMPPTTRLGVGDRRKRLVVENHVRRDAVARSRGLAAPVRSRSYNGSSPVRHRDRASSACWHRPCFGTWPVASATKPTHRRARVSRPRDREPVPRSRDARRRTADAPPAGRRRSGRSCTEARPRAAAAGTRRRTRDPWPGGK